MAVLRLPLGQRARRTAAAPVAPALGCPSRQPRSRRPRAPAGAPDRGLDAPDPAAGAVAIERRGDPLHPGPAVAGARRAQPTARRARGVGAGSRPAAGGGGAGASRSRPRPRIRAGQQGRRAVGRLHRQADALTSPLDLPTSAPRPAPCKGGSTSNAAERMTNLNCAGFEHLPSASSAAGPARRGPTRRVPPRVVSGPRDRGPGSCPRAPGRT
jgi:hypothetical protein